MMVANVGADVQHFVLIDWHFELHHDTATVGFDYADNLLVNVVALAFLVREDCTPDDFREVSLRVHEHGLPVVAHVPESLAKLPVEAHLYGRSVCAAIHDGPDCDIAVLQFARRTAQNNFRRRCRALRRRCEVFAVEHEYFKRGSVQRVVLRGVDPCWRLLVLRGGDGRKEDQENVGASGLL